MRVKCVYVIVVKQFYETVVTQQPNRGSLGRGRWSGIHNYRRKKKCDFKYTLGENRAAHYPRKSGSLCNSIRSSWSFFTRTRGGLTCTGLRMRHLLPFTHALIYARILFRCYCVRWIGSSPAIIIIILYSLVYLYTLQGEDTSILYLARIYSSREYTTLSQSIMETLRQRNTLYFVFTCWTVSECFRNGQW